MTSALIALPGKEVAPGIRDGIRQRAGWSLEELVDGFGLVAPAEGGGSVFPYFQITKLCDAGTNLTASTWQPLVDHPAVLPSGEFSPRTRPGGAPDPDWRKTLKAHADSLAGSGLRGAELAAISAMIGALEPHEVPSYLQAQVPVLFEGHPDGALWFFQADGLLSRRLGLLRVLLAFELLPDYAQAVRSAEDAHPQIKTLQVHTLTHGFEFHHLVEPILLSIPPAALGYVCPWSPNALVFTFGYPASLVDPHPATFASLYAPGLQFGEFGAHWDAAFFEGITRGEIESLLQWWVSRLNVIYSHATDPTAFANKSGRTLPSEMTTWLMTVERMLADLLAIASIPQGAPITRLTMAFDLLDKAEALLGYGKQRTGDGMKRLLNRTEMLRRLNRVWDDRLPLQLRDRFKRHTHELYDRVYEGVRDEAYDYRVHGNGIRVWAPETRRLRQWSWDAYVPVVVRGVRNSAHGLLEALDSAERAAIESHSGQLPAELPDLACLIAIALIADAEKLCAGTWL